VPNAPVLTQINLVARDHRATCDFYRRLGLDVPDGAWSDGIRHSEITGENGFELAIDNEHLAKIYHAGWRRPGGSSRALIGFSVATRDEVDRLYAELTGAGHPGIQQPYDTFWGARYAIVADPDGNDVGIMSPPEESRRSWPPKESPAP
jgi:predicted lactoylglutathione lyase